MDARHAILHCPAGDGHPYQHGDDERVPWQPVTGEPVRLGVLALTHVTAVDLQVRPGAAGTVTTLALDRSPEAARAAPTGAEGHLEAAQAGARGPAERTGWTTILPEAPAGGWSYRFIARDAAGGRTVSEWYDVVSGCWVETCTAVLRCDRAVPGRTQWLVRGGTPVRLRFALPLEPHEHVVGLGERYDRLDQRGLTPDVRVFEQYKNQGRAHRTYFPMPFAHVVGGAGWGFYVETAHRVRTDLGAAQADLIQVEVDLDDGGGGREEGGTGGPEVVVHTWDGRPAEVLASFLRLVGEPAEMPSWVYGLWASGNEWNDQRTVMEQVRRHEREGVPISVVVIEAWSDEEGFCLFRGASLTADPGLPYEASAITYPADGPWPDPRAMVDELHRRGVKVVLWQVPLQKDEEGLGEAARAQRDALVSSGHAVSLADGSPYRNRGWWFPGALMPDLSTTEGARWWTQWRRYLVRDIGIDGFKTDGGEHAWGRDLRFANGSAGIAGANRFPTWYVKAFGDLLASEGKAPVTFARSGFAGSQAHGAFWAGDENSTWEAFRSSVVAGLSASACGVVHWGWDIAGFSGPLPSPELYLRAWGASVFMPIMQYHSEFNGHREPCRDRTPWNVAEQYGNAQVLPVVRRLTAVREALRPYLEDQARRAVHGGPPLMRPLFFVSDDPRIWSFPHEYLLGDDILVHPITSPGVGEWEVLLPDGEWVDPWNERRYCGPVRTSRAYALDEVPVFVHAGAWERLRGAFRPVRHGAGPAPVGLE